MRESSQVATIADRSTHRKVESGAIGPAIAPGKNASCRRRRVLPRSPLAMLATALALACIGYRADSATRQTRGSQEALAAREVRVAPVTQMPLGRATVALGSLAAYDQATVSVKVPGRLRSITIDFGSVVQQGQLIAQIDPQDYQLRVQQAEAALAQARARLGLSPNGGRDAIDPERTSLVRQAKALLEEAKTNRERMSTLFEQGIVARSQLDSADASYKVALSRHEDAVEEVRNRQALLAQRRSELALARQQLADTAIFAPFEGAVQERRASIGEYLGAGARLRGIHLGVSALGDFHVHDSGVAIREFGAPLDDPPVAALVGAFCPVVVVADR
jgi:multidrug efflux pump subunit AcrA (membrane-fusion protein)